MKKAGLFIFCLLLVLSLSLFVSAEELISYSFENTENFTTVSNSLKGGKTPAVENGVLQLDGEYGLKLGTVGPSFTVSAMVKVASNGGTTTIFFKDMDNVGNKWTGIISAEKKPAFWTHGGGYSWTRVATGTTNLDEWTHIAYTENNGIGTLYANGERVGSGSVCAGNGTLYLGATYWTTDALTGQVDNVKLYDNVLSATEIMTEYEKYIDFENAIKLPKEVISDIELVKNVASQKVEWKSKNESVISPDGKITRQREDVTVTLTATIGTKATCEFEVKVLKEPVKVNDDVILSYNFTENDGEIIHDLSGNGNHASGKGGLSIDKNGAYFDGIDNFVQMPDGVLYGEDEITIITTFTPIGAQKNVFLYCFGNTNSTGYMYLNPSRPDTNHLRFAMTSRGVSAESHITSIPGIRNGQESTIVITLSDEYCSMYVDGDLVMDGLLNMKVSDLGETVSNYLGKSLYEDDPCFKGYIKKFEVLGYCMKETDIKNAYKKHPEYAHAEETACVEAVTFGENTTGVVSE